ncbi:hypothetical protein Sfum_2662 [Syntrophobacter fumaroxidans MPOB]|uniref:Uncharacterized protein n=1 Tax=Syntrophobacter fumaroxidans (strain DSM 10017 / MPOB) TaxID=335543 RepID=A0LLN8_SYNFM|nr:hypothetical protein Sfum_2662 [Syntrophobacter fumaroxidans MPOB]
MTGSGEMIKGRRVKNLKNGPRSRSRDTSPHLFLRNIGVNRISRFPAHRNRNARFIEAEKGVRFGFFPRGSTATASPPQWRRA